MTKSSGANFGAGKSWWLPWYGKKAIAAYSVAAIVVATVFGIVSMLYGDGLLRNSGRDTATELAELQATGAEVQQGGGGVQDSTIQVAEGRGLAERERVIVGESLEELRQLNGVRALRFEEQSVALSRLSGIWGVAMAMVFERNMRFANGLLTNVTLQNEPDRYRAVVEVHKTVNGKVSIAGFVEEGTVAKLVDEVNAVGNVYFYHKPEREGLVPVAIPVSRVMDWDYRGPHEFSEIAIDEGGG